MFSTAAETQRASESKPQTPIQGMHTQSCIG